MGLFGLGKKKETPAAPAKPAPAKAQAPKASKPAASSGGGGGGEIRKASVCGDGISIANFERLSYEQWQKKEGNEKKTIQDWRDAVVSSLKNAKGGDETLKYQGEDTISKGQADMFHNVANSFTDPKTKASNYTSTEPLENLLTGKVDGLTEFGSTSNYKTTRMPMWRYLKKKGLAYEGFWQHETTASWINEAGKVSYADPSEIPYLVSNVAPVGTFVKISTLDGKHSTYARVLEAGTSKAEASLKVYKNLGFENDTPNADPTDQLRVETFDGTGGLGKRVKDGAFSYENTYFNNDEIQRAGSILDKEKAAGKKFSPMNTKDDLKKAEGGGEDKQKQASADPAADAGGGAYRLEHGFQTVAIGSNMRLVGYANEQCLHDGGGHVIEGSCSVYVGKYPFARIGDATSDQLAVVTGDDTVFVGGSPTSATLA